MSIDLSKIRTLSFGSGVNKVEVYPKTIVNAITDQNGKPLETFIIDAIDENVRGFFEGNLNLNFVEKDEVYNKEELDETFSNYVLKTESQTELLNLKSSIVGNVGSNLNTLEKLSNAINDDPDFYNTISEEIAKKLDESKLTELVYTKSEVDTKIQNIDLSKYYTKEEVYSKSELYTLEEVNALLETLETDVSNTYATNASVTIQVNNLTNKVTKDYATISYTNEQLEEKVDKIPGRTLSEQNFTSAMKNKLDNIEENSNNYVHPETHNANMIMGLHKIATSGDYENLSNTPSNLSDFNNDCNYITDTMLDNEIEANIQTMDDNEVSDLLYYILN